MIAQFHQEEPKGVVAITLHLIQTPSPNRKYHSQPDGISEAAVHQLAPEGGSAFLNACVGTKIGLVESWGHKMHIDG